MHCCIPTNNGQKQFYYIYRHQYFSAAVNMKLCTFKLPPYLQKNRYIFYLYPVYGF